MSGDGKPLEARRLSWTGRLLYPAMNNEKARRRWAAKRRRRWAVVLAAVSTLLFLASFAVPFSPWLIVAALVPFCYFTGVLNLITRGSMELSERDLDERQVQQRRRATSLGHSVTAVALLIGWGVCSVLLFSEAAVPMRVLMPLVGGLVFLHGLFPRAYLAWTMPDEPADEEE